MHADRQGSRLGPRHRRRHSLLTRRADSRSSRKAARCPHRRQHAGRPPGVLEPPEAVARTPRRAHGFKAVGVESVIVALSRSPSQLGGGWGALSIVLPSRHDAVPRLETCATASRGSASGLTLSRGACSSSEPGVSGSATETLAIKAKGEVLGRPARAVARRSNYPHASMRPRASRAGWVASPSGHRRADEAPADQDDRPCGLAAPGAIRASRRPREFSSTPPEPGRRAASRARH